MKTIQKHQVGKYLCQRINDFVDTLFEGDISIESIEIGVENWDILTEYLRTDPDIEYGWYSFVDKRHGMSGITIKWREPREGYSEGILTSQDIKLHKTVSQMLEYYSHKERLKKNPPTPFNFNEALQSI